MFGINVFGVKATLFELPKLHLFGIHVFGEVKMVESKIMKEKRKIIVECFWSKKIFLRKFKKHWFLYICVVKKL